MFGIGNGFRGHDEEEEGLVLDLEQNSLEAVVSKRAHARFSFTGRILVRPEADARMTQAQIAGEAVNGSLGGVMCTLPEPLLAGMFYLVSCESTTMRFTDVPARCVRTRYIDDENFEAAFAFRTPLSDLGADGPETAECPPTP